jgi:hypothetical protein
MQHRVYIAALVIVALAAAAAVPRANAEPLTIMAIAGLVTVLSVSTVDMAVHSDDNSNKDMRAQQEETGQLQAKADAGAKTFTATAPTISATSVASP